MRDSAVAYITIIISMAAIILALINRLFPA